MSRFILASAAAAMLTGGMIGVALGRAAERPRAMRTRVWSGGGNWMTRAPMSRRTPRMWRRHGTLYGGPSCVPGHIGEALRFDGYDDYVDTYYNENLPVWTVSAWVISPRAPGQPGVGGPVHREANFQFNWNHDDSQFPGDGGSPHRRHLVSGELRTAVRQPMVSPRGDI